MPMSDESRVSLSGERTLSPELPVQDFETPEYTRMKADRQRIEESQSGGWRRFAMECARYLSAEQIASATEAAGGQVFICAPVDESVPSGERILRGVPISFAALEVVQRFQDAVDEVSTWADDTHESREVVVERLTKARNQLHAFISNLESEVSRLSTERDKWREDWRTTNAALGDAHDVLSLLSKDKERMDELERLREDDAHRLSVSAGIVMLRDWYPQPQTLREAADSSLSSTPQGAPK